MNPAASGRSGIPAPDGWSALGASVQLVVTDPARLEQGRALLAAGLEAADAACSRLRPDSEIVALDRPDTASAAGDLRPPGGSSRPVRVSSLLADAIAAALQAARLTSGEVDPTVGESAGEASGPGADPPASRGPSLDVLLRPAAGWQQVSLDVRSRLLRLPAGVRLDLGATARAWAADRNAAALAEALGCGVLVGIGGDIAVAGQVPRGGWRIRVQELAGHPEEPPRGPFTVVAITDGGLATSSTAVRRRRRDADLLHYISDPRTGLPAAPFWRTVSVAAASCTAASAASTAAMIRGRRALDWLATLRTPARLVSLDGYEHTVAGWPAAA